MSRQTSTSIEYSLFDTSASEDAQFSMQAVQAFSNFESLKDEKGVLQKWQTMELNEFLLDGSYLLMKPDMGSEFMGVWSKEQSDEECNFAEPPVLYVRFKNAHASAGITLLFSNLTSDWCSHLKIDWLDSSGQMIESGEFFPDSAAYFCDQRVIDYYGLNITFLSTNKPHRYLKLVGMHYGVLIRFYPDRIVSCSILEEVDPISAELSVNTMEFSFHSEKGEFDLLDLTGAYALFQQRQKISVMAEIDGVKFSMGAFYLDEPKTNSEDNTVLLKCIDLVGILDDTNYLGGYWPEGISAGQLIDDIMQSADIGVYLYRVEEECRDITVKGYLPICTHREALQQVAFAIGAIVDCSRTGNIQVKRLQKNEPSVIPFSRVVIGHSQKQEPMVTGVEVYVHTYTLPEDGNSSELFNDYMEAGDQMIQLSSPAAGFSISGAAIVESGVNYVKVQVTAAGTVVLSGKNYEDNMSLAGSVYAREIPANAIPNIKTVQDCTLNSDAQSMAQRIYDYYQQRLIDNGSIILSEEVPGSQVGLINGNGRLLSGTIQQLDIDVAGGLIAKAEIRGTGESGTQKARR